LASPVMDLSVAFGALRAEAAPAASNGSEAALRRRARLDSMNFPKVDVWLRIL
jgi:hypothetical protein